MYRHFVFSFFSLSLSLSLSLSFSFSLSLSPPLSSSSHLFSSLPSFPLCGKCKLNVLRKDINKNNNNNSLIVHSRSTLLYPLLLNAKQGSNNSHLLTSFGMTRPGFEPTTRLWGGRSTDWANTPVVPRLSTLVHSTKTYPLDHSSSIHVGRG